MAACLLFVKVSTSRRLCKNILKTINRNEWGRTNATNKV